MLAHLKMTKTFPPYLTTFTPNTNLPIRLNLPEWWGDMTWPKKQYFPKLSSVLDHRRLYTFEKGFSANIQYTQYTPSHFLAASTALFYCCVCLSFARQLDSWSCWNLGRACTFSGIHLVVLSSPRWDNDLQDWLRHSHVVHCNTKPKTHGTLPSMTRR